MYVKAIGKKKLVDIKYFCKLNKWNTVSENRIMIHDVCKC